MKTLYIYKNLTIDVVNVLVHLVSVNTIRKQQHTMKYRPSRHVQNWCSSPRYCSDGDKPGTLQSCKYRSGGDEGGVIMI